MVVSDKGDGGELAADCCIQNRPACQQLLITPPSHDDHDDDDDYDYALAPTIY